MSDTAKHTQLPWNATPDGYLAAPSDQMNGGYYVAQVFGPDLIENQKLIERAVNCHGELLAIAKRILERGYVSEHIDEERSDHLALAAAIAKAEGGDA